MKINKLKEMTTEELNKELMNLKDQLFKLRFQHATNNLDNPLQLKTIKKEQEK